LQKSRFYGTVNYAFYSPELAQIKCQENSVMKINCPKEPLVGTVRDIKPIEIQMVSNSALEPLWDELVSQYRHYIIRYAL
jgi:hypothetical protein